MRHPPPPPLSFRQILVSCHPSFSFLTSYLLSHCQARGREAVHSLTTFDAWYHLQASVSRVPWSILWPERSRTLWHRTRRAVLFFSSCEDVLSRMSDLVGVSGSVQGCLAVGGSLAVYRWRMPTILHSPLEGSSGWNFQFCPCCCFTVAPHSAMSPLPH